MRDATVRLITLCLIIGIGIPKSYSAELHVPAQFATIQAAVDAAIPGDTVLVADGTWSGVGNVTIHPDGKAITIRSASGDPEACTIDGSGIDQGFVCASAETRDTVIMGFTLYRCGRDPNLGPVDGAGISCVNASPTIRHCRFVDGYASWSYPGPGSGMYGSGGAIACSDGAAPEIADCVFITCIAGESGGAIHARDAAPVILDCAFTDNRSYGRGGAINLKDSPAVINGCVFTDNRAVNGDGGALCLDASSAEITLNEFTLNRSLRGGAVACLGATPIIGGASDLGNRFDRNYSGSGADLFAQVPASTIDARFNTFTGLMMSDYCVSPQETFDLSGSQTTATPIQSDVFVAQDGSDENSGLSIDAPFRTIQFALSRVLPTEASPITIHIASGEYSAFTTGEAFPLPLLSHLSLSGADQCRTHLNPSYQSVCLFGHHDTDVRIDGIDIRGGSGESGGGLHASDCQVELTNLTVRESVAEKGAAMYLSGTDASMRSVLIMDNYSRYMGSSAGVVAIGGHLRILDSVITRNASDGPGGGVYVQGAALIASCRITENEARRASGGGVFCADGPLEMVNCELIRNRAILGGGVFVTGQYDLLNCLIAENTAVLSGASFQSFDASGLIRHSTIAANTTSGSVVSSVFFEQSDSTVSDSIVWNESGAEIQVEDAQLSVTNCDVRGGFEGAGNIDSDPQFTAMPMSNYYLNTGESGDPISPCIDAGGKMAAECTYSGLWGEIDLERWTAGSDWLRDSGVVDIGVHWDHALFSGVRLDLTTRMLHPGDRLRLDAVVLNHSGVDWSDSRLFVILDVYGSYWFAPSWAYMDDGFDWYSMDLAPGARNIVSVIPDTVWPEGVGSADNLAFWGGLTDGAFLNLRGDFDRVIFGYRD